MENPHPLFDRLWQNTDGVCPTVDAGTHAGHDFRDVASVSIDISEKSKFIDDPYIRRMVKFFKEHI